MEHYRLTPTLHLRIRTNKHPAKIGQSKAIGYKNKLHSPATDLEALIEAFGQSTVHQLVDAIVRLRQQHPNSVFKLEEVL